MSSKRILKVGSRESKLALIQSKFLISKLKEKHPDIEFQTVTMTTPGDRTLDKSILKIGESALWTLELETSLKSGKVDILVHSLKDVYSDLPDGLVLGCVLKRANPCDAIVMNPKHKGQTLASLPKGSVVGTSSLRRAAQIKRSYPHLEILNVRGNIDGRIDALDNRGKYDALCLAAAALERMGPEYEIRTSQILTPEECLYAVSQAAMAAECRADDTEVLELLDSLHDQETSLRVVAERAYQKTLKAGCSEPVGIHSVLQDNILTVKGGVFSADGQESVYGEEVMKVPNGTSTLLSQGIQSNGIKQYSNIVRGKGGNSHALKAAEDMGVTLANKMIAKGAERILSKVRQDYHTA